MRYVDFEKQEGKLVIKLTADDKEAADDSMGFSDLIEWQLGNGWEWVWPEEIGALTDAPIISDDVSRNDAGELISVGTVYAYMDYQVFDPAEQLIKRGEITLIGA